MIGQNAILACDGHNVRGNAEHYEVEQGDELAELNAVIECKGLHQLESNTTAREMWTGVVGVVELGIEDGDGRG